MGAFSPGLALKKTLDRCGYGNSTNLGWNLSWSLSHTSLPQFPLYKQEPQDEGLYEAEKK